MGRNRRWYGLAHPQQEDPQDQDPEPSRVYSGISGWLSHSFLFIFSLCSFHCCLSSVAAGTRELFWWFFFGGGPLCLSVLRLPPLLLSCLQTLALAADLAFIRRVESFQFAFHCLDTGCDVYIAASHNMPIYGKSLIWSCIEEEEASSTNSGPEIIFLFSSQLPSPVISSWLEGWCRNICGFPYVFIKLKGREPLNCTAWCDLESGPILMLLYDKNCVLDL